jgi:hypothetical protein
MASTDGGLLKRQGGSQHRGRHGGICLAAGRSAAGQGFARRLRTRWLAVPVGTGVHARRCWFRWAAWLGEQSVAPVAADGRHTNHCFESAAHRPTAAVRLSLHPGPSDTHTPGLAALEPGGFESAARASPPLSARLAASGRADAEPTPQCCCSPSSCACNAALSGRPRACSCCTSIANTRLGQSAPAPPAYAPSATRRVPSFHTRFDHARSGLIDRQPMTSSQSVDSARLSFQRIRDADSSNAT